MLLQSQLLILLPPKHPTLFHSLLLIAFPEPISYKQYSVHAKWVVGMNKELIALEDNHTWDLTNLPVGKKSIGSKWVYKVKVKPDGSVDMFKARLEAKGYNQIERIDYFDSFSPIAKLVIVKLFLAIPATKSRPIHQLDINNVFLHDYLDEKVYMQPSEGYTKATPSQVCKLKRSLYNLKQASG